MDKIEVMQTYDFTQDAAFLAAWAKLEKQGYLYSDSNISKVYLGWCLATRTDATPVAEPRTIYVQFSDNGNIRKWAWTEFDLAEKLKVETLPVSDTPFAWAYQYTQKHPGQTKPGAMDIKRDRHKGPIASGWTETPLYTHPPATDVAALVEVLRHVTECLVVEMGNLANEDETDDADLQGILGSNYARQVIAARLRIRQARQALAPFTKGQNDD